MGLFWTDAQIERSTQPPRTSFLQDMRGYYSTWRAATRRSAAAPTRQHSARTGGQTTAYTWCKVCKAWTKYSRTANQIRVSAPKCDFSYTRANDFSSVWKDRQVGGEPNCSRQPVLTRSAQAGTDAFMSSQRFQRPLPQFSQHRDVRRRAARGMRCPVRPRRRRRGTPA
jgi:hypothetical protein